MLVIATILDNPGEPPAKTIYRNPRELRGLGYTDLAIYSTTGLSGLTGPDCVRDADQRRWLETQYESIIATADEARSAGMGVWITYDAPSLARELVTPEMCCTDQPDTLCPASPALLEQCEHCLEALMSKTGPLTGVVLRLGDNDAHRLPYLMGNDLYSPYCAKDKHIPRSERLITWIQRFYDLVVRKHGKRLIVRGWNLKPGGLHDNPAFCKKVIDQLPNDERLIFSFKITQTDFWRYQKWNPSSLVCDGRPIIYELECQREYEGKGAIPNYQAGLWADGFPEVDEPGGLANLPQDLHLVGLWGWVRGGGWGGPFISNELWIDANVYAIPKLAAEFRKDPNILAREWIEIRQGCTDTQAAEAIVEVMELSAQAILSVFYVGVYAKKLAQPWHPACDFIEDDVLYPEKALQLINQLPESDLDDVLSEKQQAVEMFAHCRRRLQQSVHALKRPHGETMIHTLEYAESLASAIRHLFAGLIDYRRYRKYHNAIYAQNATERLFACQRDWNHHTQRIASFPGTATAFRSDDLWSFTQHIIDELAQHSRHSA